MVVILARVPRLGGDSILLEGRGVANLWQLPLLRSWQVEWKCDLKLPGAFMFGGTRSIVDKASGDIPNESRCPSYNRCDCRCR
jgi:hypothetical protein